MPPSGGLSLSGGAVASPEFVPPGLPMTTQVPSTSATPTSGPASLPQEAKPTIPAWGTGPGTMPDPWQPQPQATTAAPQNPFSAQVVAPPAYSPPHGEFRIDFKRVQNVSKLDLDTDVKLFKTWELQAEDLITGGRGDVQKLLDYVAKSGMPITKDMEATWSSPTCDVVSISAQIYSGLIHITTGGIMQRLATEAGKGCGLEIWRLIQREWRSESPPSFGHIPDRL